MKHWHHHTWPRLANRRHEVACHFCDTLHDVQLIEEGTEAQCLTCGHVLYRNRPQSLERAVAFGATGCLLLIAMLLLPFIILEVSGNELSVTAGETVLRLWSMGSPVVSVSVFVFIMLFPLMQVLCLLYLGIPLLAGRVLNGSIFVAKLLQNLQAWVMVEVFFLGTLVSLLKLIKLADVTLGLGFWAMVGLMLSLAAGIGGIDRLELWDRIEVALARRNVDQVVVEGGA